jgi:hypothetical protein
MRLNGYSLIKWLMGYGDLTDGIKARNCENSTRSYEKNHKIKQRKTRADKGKPHHKYRKFKQPMTDEEKKERRKRYNQTYQMKKRMRKQEQQTNK